MNVARMKEGYHKQWIANPTCYTIFKTSSQKWKMKEIASVSYKLQPLLINKCNTTTTK